MMGLEEVERDHIVHALEASNWVVGGRNGLCAYAGGGEFFEPNIKEIQTQVNLLLFNPATRGFRCIPIGSRLFVAIAAILTTAQASHAQQGILGTNLIVNGNAEAGTAATGSKDVVAIPGWTRTGNATVLPYGLTGYVQTTDPAPTDHLFQYFIGSAANTVSTLSQDIDVSSGASLINAGNIKYTASAYLGSWFVRGGGNVQMSVAFKNASGQTFSTVPIGPGGLNGSGTSLQQEIGLVPVGTARITVTLTMTNGNGVADSLSLVLTALGTVPGSVEGFNLLANGNAEAGPSAISGIYVANVPGWSTSDASVCPYGGAGWIAATDPGPSDRGVNLFCGGGSTSNGGNGYQDLDVSAAASMIDAGQVTYQVAAWLGIVGHGNSPTLSYMFFDWTGKQLAATAQLGPLTPSSIGLGQASNTGMLPVGTRRVRVTLTFPGTGYIADDIFFSIGNAAAPVIAPSGVVPVYSAATTVESGSWISIYGTGLASATTAWNGDFPTILAGTSVTIDSKPAYLWFVSPTQINLQVPNDTATGTVPVVVATPVGSFTTDVTLGQYAPSFSLFNGKYAAAIVATSGSGNSGNGYDYIGPIGAFVFPSRPVKAGETLLLYGVGFGPTTPPVAAGAVFSGAAPCVNTPTVTIGGVPAQVTFAGIVEAGLYQFNVVVPSAGSGDKLLQAMVGGVTTPDNVYITLQ